MVTIPRSHGIYIPSSSPHRIRRDASWRVALGHSWGTLGRLQLAMQPAVSGIDFFKLRCLLTGFEYVLQLMHDGMRKVRAKHAILALGAIRVFP